MVFDEGCPGFLVLYEFFEKFVEGGNVFVNDGYVRDLIGVCVFKKWINFVYILLFVHDYNAITFVSREDDVRVLD